MIDAENFIGELERHREGACSGLPDCSYCVAESREDRDRTTSDCGAECTECWPPQETGGEGGFA
jgi:hypothetical protein